MASLASSLPPMPNAVWAYSHPGMYMVPNAFEICLAHADDHVFSDDPSEAEKEQAITRNRLWFTIPLDTQQLLSITGKDRENCEKAYRFAREFFQNQGDWRGWDAKTFERFAVDLNHRISFEKDSKGYRRQGVSYITRKPEAPDLLGDCEGFLKYLEKNDPDSIPYLHEFFSGQASAFNRELATSGSMDPIGESRVLSPGVKKFLKKYIWVFPPCSSVPGRMARLIEDFQKSLREKDPIKSASLLHTRFVMIHPFKDGNGRAARMLMNIALVQGGLPPLFFSSEKEYDQAVERAHEDPDSFTEFLREKMEELQTTLALAAKIGASDPYAYAEHLPLMRNLQRVASHPNVQKALREAFPPEDHKELIEASPAVAAQSVGLPPSSLVPAQKSGLSRRAIQIGLGVSIVAILVEIFRRTVFSAPAL